MSSFILSSQAIDAIDAKVSGYVGDVRYAYQIDESAAMEAYGPCGCGVGGSCSNSCVSGCAERGSCCSYGPK